MVFVCVDAETLYARDDKLRKGDVQILQEWQKKQPHLPQLQESQLIVFLHSCYYRIELTKTTIDKYFTKRNHHPDLFDCLTEEALTKALSVAFINILPKKTPQGFVIILMKLLDLNPDNYNFGDLVKVINMVATLYMHQIGYEKGGIVVFDCKGFTFNHLTRFNISVVKHALEHLQEGVPLRLKGIHFINIVPVLDKSIALVKPFLKSGVFNLLNLHSSEETFYKYVPRDCMPEDYGGESPSCQALRERNLRNLLENSDFFEWHNSQKVNESKRIGKYKNHNFGVEGTFKKLQID